MNTTWFPQLPPHSLIFHSVHNSLRAVDPHCVTCLASAGIEAPDASFVSVFPKVSSTHPQFYGLLVGIINVNSWLILGGMLTLIKIDPFSPKTARTHGPQSSPLAAPLLGR